MQRVLILGHGGMLGHVVGRHLSEKGYAVKTLSVRFTVGSADAFFAAVEGVSPLVVINCIGAITQKAHSREAMYEANAILPWLLRARLSPGSLLIQPSTDCVFAGKRGNVDADSVPDAEDDYGLSKAIGESVRMFGNTLVVRCSIIGPEASGPGYGLLGWFTSRVAGSTVEGYSDHLWNGITSLEWAKLVADRIESWLTGERKGIIPLVQPGTARTHSKAEVLAMIKRLWGVEVGIRVVETLHPRDMTLLPSEVRKPLQEELEELRDWYNK